MVVVVDYDCAAVVVVVLMVPNRFAWCDAGHKELASAGGSGLVRRGSKRSPQPGTPSRQQIEHDFGIDLGPLPAHVSSAEGA